MGKLEDEGALRNYLCPPELNVPEDPDHAVMWSPGATRDSISIAGETSRGGGSERPSREPTQGESGATDARTTDAAPSSRIHSHENDPFEDHGGNEHHMTLAPVPDALLQSGERDDKDFSPDSKDGASYGKDESASTGSKSNLGKRTQRGCLTCRKRRVKCGEEHPICIKCVKSKRHCEGYKQRFFFEPPTGLWPTRSTVDSASFDSTLPGYYADFQDTYTKYYPLSGVPFASRPSEQDATMPFTSVSALPPGIMDPNTNIDICFSNQMVMFKDESSDKHQKATATPFPQSLNSSMGRTQSSGGTGNEHPQEIWTRSPSESLFVTAGEKPTLAHQVARKFNTLDPPPLLPEWSRLPGLTINELQIQQTPSAPDIYFHHWTPPTSQNGDSDLRQRPAKPSSKDETPIPVVSRTEKHTIAKARPCIRDHTTDQLNAEGDEYIPREFDENGEKKLGSNGEILGSREYCIRTFQLQTKGSKLFMLTTECARVLGYRDSYLLFNKNRSLYKIVLTQAETDELIDLEMLPYSYRSRQLAIVSARSVFRQFGSRVIVNGRRVRDDYWELKARKQGFTEADAAGERIPGVVKQLVEHEQNLQADGPSIIRSARTRASPLPLPRHFIFANQGVTDFESEIHDQEFAEDSEMTVTTGAAAIAEISQSEQNSHPVGGVAPSDSGYHTGIGTDTESVCSEGSVGSSLGLSHNFLQEFVAFFGDVLIERAGARNWGKHTLAQYAPDFIEKKLNSLLKEYAVELSQTKDTLVEDYLRNRTPARAVGTDVRIANGATKLIRRYRPKITRYFRDNVSATPITADSIASRLQELSKQLSLTERMGLFERRTGGKSNHNEEIDEFPVEEDDDDAEDCDYAADLEPIRAFLVSGEPFQHLLTAMRRSLYYDDQSGMDQARHHVMAALSGSHSSICSQTELPVQYWNSSAQRDVNEGCKCLYTDRHLHLNVDWSLPQFLKSQFGRRHPRLGSLITLTGSALYAQATTCLEYLDRTWPNSGRLFLDSLQDAMNKSNADPRGAVNAEYYYKDLSLRIDLGHTLFLQDDNNISRMRIHANGPSQMLLELTQQVAWIGAVMNLSPSEDELVYSEAVIAHHGSSLDISFLTRALPLTERPCWLPLFCGATIAKDFPVPERQDETGLEIPIDVMAALAGVRHAVEYAGGIVMKGFSSMFVPIKRLGNLVQWHFISSPDCETRLSYQDALEQCQNRATVKELSLDSLLTTRAIVGWCSAATTTLGSESANYENIDYSGAKDAENPLKFAGGSLGFQQFGVAQFDFSFGPKDGKCHFQRNGPYRRIVSAADRAAIALYDTAEKRAWLVPASSVILHIAQHRHWLEPFEVDDQPVKLFSSSPVGSSAKEILLKNASTELSDSENYTFQDMVTSIWSLLEFLIDQDVKIDRTSGTTIEIPCQDILKGFEFKAVVEERSPFRQKQTTIQKTCGGWPTLVRDIDALVLFANGFEDLIQPLKDRNKGLCSIWQRVPKCKDYMATSVKILNDLYNVAGRRLDRDHLTSTQLQWHRGNSTLFESCTKPGAYRCKCVRLQQIIPKSAIGTIVPPGQLMEHGAVIFGQSCSGLQKLKPVEKASVSKGLYSQPNISLAPIVLSEDFDESTSVNSDSETLVQTGSDGTDRTPSSSITSYTTEYTRDTQDVNMTDLHLEPSISRKRPCPRDGSVDGLRPSLPCLFPDSNKRTKSVVASDAANFDCYDFGHCQPIHELSMPNLLGNEITSLFDPQEDTDPNHRSHPSMLKRQAARNFSQQASYREP